VLQPPVFQVLQPPVQGAGDGACRSRRRARGVGNIQRPASQAGSAWDLAGLDACSRWRTLPCAPAPQACRRSPWPLGRWATAPYTHCLSTYSRDACLWALRTSQK
jgi:hypothetical protein